MAKWRPALGKGCGEGGTTFATALQGIHDFPGPSDIMGCPSMIALRLIDFCRVLKPTGNICLQRDPHRV
jgi:hypothetical protein